MTAKAGSARQVALNVLVRVARDGAYADRALDVALDRSALSDRDRGLATELVYGTLRQQIYIDFLLSTLADRPLKKTAPIVRESLRMGAYQILETRVPAHAAVNEAVALVQHDFRHAAGFVNAVLRKLATLKEEGQLPRVSERVADELEALAIAGAHAPWIVQEVARRRGADAARAFIAANNQRPPLSLRVNESRATRDEVRRELEAQGIEVEVPPRVATGLIAKHAGDVGALPGLAAGRFTVQDLGAQLIGELSRPEPGAFVLDACAAPGGKATHLAEMTPSATVLATDLHAGKTRLIDAHALRLGLANLRSGVVDATDPDALGMLLTDHGRDHVDLALVDAPCSGLGTLRRNPELRSSAKDRVKDLTRLQDQLLDAIATAVRPGGFLVYAVCTITEAEGPERIAEFLKRNGDFEPSMPESPVLAPLFVEHAGEAGRFTAVAMWTDLHDTDGFFAVRLRRR